MSKIPRKRKKQFGSLATTGSLLDQVKQGVVNSVAAGVLLGIAGALLPQFAAPSTLDTPSTSSARKQSN